MSDIDIDLVTYAFELAIHSMDFGSGFWCDDDVIAMRRLARQLGRDPAEATPSSWSETLVDGKPKWGAIEIESDHVCQRHYEWLRGASRISTRCICGWVSVIYEQQKLVDPSVEDHRLHNEEFQRLKACADKEASAHIEDMLSAAKGDG